MTWRTFRKLKVPQFLALPGKSGCLVAPTDYASTSPLVDLNNLVVHNTDYVGLHAGDQTYQNKKNTYMCFFKMEGEF